MESLQSAFLGIGVHSVQYGLILEILVIKQVKNMCRKGPNDGQSMDNVWTDWGVDQSIFRVTGLVDQSHSTTTM